MIEGVKLQKLQQHQDGRGWLTEAWRCDSDEDHVAVMAYVSLTRPGVVRGPHEHEHQADYFVFLTSTWRVSLWENRGLNRYRVDMREPWVLTVSEPSSLLIPAGVIHAYQNVGLTEGLVLNLPDRLYGGWKRSESVDEIRHESDPQSLFQL